MSYYYEVYAVVDGDLEYCGEGKRPDELIDGKGTFFVVGEEFGDLQIVNPKIVAVLSSAVLIVTGLYKSYEVDFPSDLSGVPSYCGHPNTRALLEVLGAEYTPGRWAGPEIGESFLAVPLAQNEREGGYTKDVAVAAVDELKAILVTRVA